jgi:hypothetical protein|tara:strand:+ start:70 stop:195 length:126 start_codon:yes stop_codon:yes gene_type:complete
MKEILKRIKKESLKITGGEFAQWYESLSPIERVAYNKTLRK